MALYLLRETFISTSGLRFGQLFVDLGLQSSCFTVGIAAFRTFVQRSR